MPGTVGRRTIIAAIALLVVGFGGGFLTARMAPPAPTSGAPASATSSGFPWSMFGKPRPADAPRALPPKPDGFAVWTSHLDVTASGPSACIRMSRPLDPRRSYGDFVTVSPELGHQIGRAHV